MSQWPCRLASTALRPSPSVSNANTRVDTEQHWRGQTFESASLLPRNRDPSATAFSSSGAEQSLKTKVGRWMTGKIGTNFVKNMCMLLSRNPGVRSAIPVGEVTLVNYARY